MWRFGTTFVLKTLGEISHLKMRMYFSAWFAFPELKPGCLVK